MTEEPDDTTSPAAPSRGKSFDLRRPQARLGAVVAIALLVGFVVWLVVRRGDSDSETSGPAPAAAKPVLVSGSALQTIASAVNRPIYWAGAKPSLKYELTKTSDGRVWIRYLPPDEEIGEEETPYLTVGTYPVAGAYAVTSSAARNDGAVRLAAGDGAVAFYTKERPTNVYVAFRGSEYQVEVFDPSADTAQQLVRRRQIKPVAGSPKPTSPATTPTLVTEAGLKRVAAAASAPVYWLGPEPNVRYEVTHVPDGRIYVRYLPAGVAAGSSTQYRTVGTYPVKDALAATKAAATGGDTETLDIGGGGFAFYSTSSPTNVHLAYPGIDYQIEVFDPSAERAHELATSSRLTTVR